VPSHYTTSRAVNSIIEPRLWPIWHTNPYACVNACLSLLLLLLYIYMCLYIYVCEGGKGGRGEEQKVEDAHFHLGGDQTETQYLEDVMRTSCDIGWCERNGE